ncbi:SdiA-regulated domain-containing protein [Reichenbachiella sp. MSK19-1]|uniref:SdiA-regulated domain-containing protein n=1 Tax=Reichenbachiella sp. MSK19-1 TaxID=1897631 RepID=UPI000E6C3D23|nr:SdiA-regulated domain-containing protein [Reichenbachiella sp. MSK19-1]RJE70381.1 hypothetical protein BGP76_09815 [Reichenbachiella sp. MSK19-1]
MIKVMRMTVCLWLSSMTIQCNSQNLDYDLNNPNHRVRLSGELDEISGMTTLSDSIIAAVQDEKGRIYYLDARTGAVMYQIDFGKDGDFEGITYGQKMLYMLRSDGAIFRFDEKENIQEYQFKHSKHFDFEGLCFDGQNRRILVACKEHGDKDERDHFFIYSFSLESNRYEKKPAYKIKRNQVHKKFKPSGIAIHPNGNIYIVSSFSKTLLVLDVEGVILHIVQLNEQLFSQPEGVAFDTFGNLFISNEKQDRASDILRFNFLH